MKRRSQHNHILKVKAVQDQCRSSTSIKMDHKKWNLWLRKPKLLFEFACRRNTLIVVFFIVSCLVSLFQILHRSVHPNSEQRRRTKFEEVQGGSHVAHSKATSGISEISKEAITLVDVSDLKEKSRFTTQSPEQRQNDVSHRSFITLEDPFLRTLKSSLKGVLTINHEQVKNRVLRNDQSKWIGIRWSKRVKPVMRIGILAPPGFVSTIATKWIREHVSTIQAIDNNMLTETKSVALTMLSSSHVPPYGYGKNHGMYKIIRLTTVPVLFAVTDMMLFTIAYHGLDVDEKVKMILADNNNNNNNNGLKHAILGGMLRQYVRWHCRLSHVAAHTAVETVFLSPEALQLYPEAILQNVTNFIFQNPQDRMYIAKNAPIIIPEREKLKLSEHIRNIELYSSEYLQESENDCNDFEKSFHCILRDELDSTNQLQDWPCRSLWENIPRQKMPKSNDTLSHTNIQDLLLFQMASRLGPTCQEEFVNCTVREDLCVEAVDLSGCV